MSDMHTKRKYAGEPHKDQRAAPAPEVERLPPHKKERRYRLTVRYEKTITEVCTKDFATKDAMREFRARVEREIAKARAEKPRKTWRFWGLWSSDLKMDSETSSVLKKHPMITEELL